MTTSPQLLKQAVRFVVVTSAAACAVIIVWVKLFYDRHYNAFSGILGDGFFNSMVTTLVVLCEALAPVHILVDKRLSHLQDKLFDETLKLRGQVVVKVAAADKQHVAAQAAKTQSRGGALGGTLLGKLYGKVLGVVQALLLPQPKEGKLVRVTRNLITLPFKILAPVLLPLFSLLVDGYAEATSLHSHYFDRKGLLDPGEQSVVASQRELEYRAFGFVASLLSAVPLLNFFLSLSNSVGAALWAAEMEKRGGPLKRRL